MFIQARCLYVIGNEKQDGQKIYSRLNSLGLIKKIFSRIDDRTDDILNFLQLLPDQTVFSKKVSKVDRENSGYYISLPFFSSHVKMPIKCGEYLWVYPYESNDSLYSNFSINSYWISRVHGLDHSEDANFTFNDRDIDIKFNSKNLSKDFKKESEVKAKKKKDLKNYKLDQNNNIVKPEIGFGNSTFELDKQEIEFLKNNLRIYPNNCVPKISNNPEDLFFQGSNNTFIKMSTDRTSDGSYSHNNLGKGEISIVSGPGKQSNSYNYSKSGLFINQRGMKYLDSSYSLQVSNGNLPNKLLHEKENFEENIKNVNLYSLEEVDNNNLEGAFSVLDDSSKIIVSEYANYESILNNNFDLYLNIGNFEDLKSTFELKSNLFIIEEEKKFNLNNFSNSYSYLSSFDFPTISLISDGINTFSRMGNGCISLIKEYYSSKLDRQLNSYVRLDKNGDIYIDGNRIFIGSESLEKEKGTFKNGQGTIVNIGLGEESQSLVLGEQLKEYMQEMISINIEDMDLTKKLFEHVRDTQADMDLNTFNEIEFVLNNTINSVAEGFVSIPPKAGQAAAAIPDILSIINNFAVDLLNAITSANQSNTDRLNRLTDEIVLAKLKKEEELSNRIKTISDNIDKILSKISKTS